MRRDLFAKLALGCAGIFTTGSLAGLGLANYVTSGSFEFYRQASVAQWRPAPDPMPVVSSDLVAAADDWPAAPDRPQPHYASYVPDR